MSTTNWPELWTLWDLFVLAMPFLLTGISGIRPTYSLFILTMGHILLHAIGGWEVAQHTAILAHTTGALVAATLALWAWNEKHTSYVYLLGFCKMPNIPSISMPTLPTLQFQFIPHLASDNMSEMSSSAMLPDLLPVSVSNSTIVSEDPCPTPTDSEHQEMSEVEKELIVKGSRHVAWDKYAYCSDGERMRMMRNRFSYPNSGLPSSASTGSTETGRN